jgi:aminoglycoside phosphotransferase (APT) family kinase protein
VGPELVAALVASQFPDFSADLTFVSEGWDNVVYRLGEDFAVRIPRHQMAASISVSELDWLPRLGPGWTFAAPVPVAIGEPGLGYPWRWSIVPWLQGNVALEAPLSLEGAADLGAALAQIHVPAPRGAPCNEWRGAPLAQRAERFDQRIAMLDGQQKWTLDAERALEIFAAADPRQELTWCHLDLHGNNVLSLEGRLGGILDWGDSGAGDPATDLGQARYLLGSEGFERLAAAYLEVGGPADPTAPRVLAEALVYAVMMATIEDGPYRASGWKSLRDLGVADRA